MNDPRPLIAHVVYHFGTGGMENGMVTLFNNLPDEAYRHVVINLAGHGEFKTRIRRDDIFFYDLDKKPGNDVSWYVRLAKLLRKLQPRILHTRNLNAMEAQLVGWLMGICGRVHSEHGREVYDLNGRNWKHRILRRSARPFIHQYITVSRDLQDWLSNSLGITNQHIRQIYNGVDVSKFHPTQSEKPRIEYSPFWEGAQFVIGSIGRMVTIKNYPILVQAFIRLCKSVSDPSGLRLVIVGEGAARAQCQKMINDAGLTRNAWFPGESNEPTDWYRAFDVFVLPSLNEGISNTILEAMASGLPVIASRVGGNPELVVENQTGTLFPSGDVDTLIQILHEYKVDSPRGHNEGAAGRRRVEMQFSIEQMVSNYKGIYDELLASCHHRKVP
ncbi:MAG TPA: TIGR03088 family PEP-CTERM/XrtA system glycosyltransferase [Thiobacillaceae bacterium]|nr:TIGR03088 family PEP-CTERM/XrtA system glycosyltransferase [Thiobacillaceae bacterium]